MTPALTDTPAVDRVDAVATAPDVFHAMASFQQAAAAHLDARLADLVRVRVSQINGCAYCVDLHARAAREAGETERRLYALPTWRESALFTRAERAALALCEALTLLPEAGVSDAVYAEAAAWFDDTALTHLLWTAAATNVWNRMAVATGMGRRTASS
ncbi:carboxymuconolactone decarboxylase family protein [Streptomyces sp. NPDC004393]|uniref:carboxymuconolactone decarboxylase family protein n=1 Tax=Streptomyces sp. NPDC004533 TaxID=3154278 RepID=UPI0033BEF663